MQLLVAFYRARNIQFSFEFYLFIFLGGSFPYTIGRISHGFDVKPDLCAVENNVSPRLVLLRTYVCIFSFVGPISETTK
jgi:hypothetical protein